MSPMNHRLMVPQKLPLLLDFAPGAAAAYSLRSLSNGYTGPVITARRASDNAEADFTASEVSDGTLAAWSSGGDAFVKQWWSQTGSNHATQATAAYQPKIVSSGIVVLEEGKPAIQFDGTDDRIDANGLSTFFSGIDKPASTATVGKCDSGISGLFFWSFGNSASDSPVFAMRSLAGYVDLVVRDNALHLHQATGGDTLSQSVVFTYSNMDTINLRQNGATIDTSAESLGSVTLNSFSIGCQTRISKSNFFDGTIQELIIYPSDMTAYRERIEGNIAWSYS